MLAQNKSGRTLLEYIDIEETHQTNEDLTPFEYSGGDEMLDIALWDMNEDIDYLDECDLKITQIVCN